MFCGVCGSKNDPNVTFCAECGSKVESIAKDLDKAPENIQPMEITTSHPEEPQSTTIMVSSEITCNQCNTVNETNAKFCKNCGSTIEVQTTPQPPTSLFCGQCGAENKPDTKFCGQCGNPLASSPTSTSAPVSHPSSHVSPSSVNATYQTPVASNKYIVGNDDPASPTIPNQIQLPPKSEWSKDPNTAHIGSLFLPGFGYYYTEEMNKAAGVFFGVVISFLIGLPSVSITIWIIQFLIAGNLVRAYEKKRYIGD